MHLRPQNACDLEQSVVALRASEPLVFETDTVVGLGIAPTFTKTPAALYDIKRRDAGKPIAWLVSDLDMMRRYACDLSPAALALACAFWPGALTIVARASDAAPREFVSAAGTLGFRVPDVSPARELLAALGAPIATTSANESGSANARFLASVDLPSPSLKYYASVAPTSPELNMAPVLASAVVDCTTACPRILREGQIDRAQIDAIIKLNA